MVVFLNKEPQRHRIPLRDKCWDVTLDYPVIYGTERPRRKSQLFKSKPKIRFFFEMSFLGNNTLKPSVKNDLANFTNIDFIILNAALSF